MRKLKYHEKKLLKKVNFLEYKREGGHREAFVTRRYMLTERDDYKKQVFFLYFSMFFFCDFCCLFMMVCEFFFS